MSNVDKSLVYGHNTVDGTFAYIFDFVAQKGYVPAIGQSGHVVQFDLTVANMAKAAFTDEWVDSDEEDEIVPDGQSWSISDMWYDALNSVESDEDNKDDETDMTDIKAHIGMIFLMLDLVRIPAFSMTSVTKVINSVRNGYLSQTDGYQAIVDGMGYEIVTT